VRREKAVRKKYQPLYKFDMDKQTKKPKINPKTSEPFPPKLRAKLQKVLPKLKGKDGKKRRATHDEVANAPFDLQLYSMECVARTEPVEEVLGENVKATPICELTGMWVTAGMCGLQFVLRQAAVSSTSASRPEGCQIQLPGVTAPAPVPAPAESKAKVAPVSVADGADSEDSEGEGEGSEGEGEEDEGEGSEGEAEEDEEPVQPPPVLKPAAKVAPVVPPPAPPAAPKAVKGEDVAPKKVAKKVVKKATAAA
jgi:hypothetical protein